MKKWVIMPRADTPEYFLARIAHDLQLVAGGFWDQMEVVEPSLVPRVSLMKRFFRIIGFVFVALIPFGCLAIAHQLGFDMKSVPTWTWIGAWLWAVVNILMAFDLPNSELALRLLGELIPKTRGGRD
jgi:hypothetical protein